MGRYLAWAFAIAIGRCDRDCDCISVGSGSCSSAGVVRVGTQPYVCISMFMVVHYSQDKKNYMGRVHVRHLRKAQRTQVASLKCVLSVPSLSVCLHVLICPCVYAMPWMPSVCCVSPPPVRLNVQLANSKLITNCLFLHAFP